MINVIDVALSVLVLVYLIQNLGWPLRILRSILIVLVSLIIFGVAAGLLSVAPVPYPVQRTIKESYFVNFSYALIKWVYPAIEKNAPKVDTFIKKEIISAPSSKKAALKIEIPEKILPKLTLPEMPKLK